MTHNLLARSLPATQRSALAGEYESQDSQEKFLRLIQQHGVGVTTNPSIANDARISQNSNGYAQKDQYSQNAVDAVTLITHSPDENTSISTGSVASSLSQFDRRVQGTTSRAASPSTKRRKRVDRGNSPSSERDGPPVAKPPNPPITENAIAHLLSSAASSKPTGAMSSQSPTQSNEDRSYDQYGEDGSPPPSTPGSVTEEPTTLQEGDTGYVNFKYPFDLPDTAPNEPDTPFHHDRDPYSLHGRPDATSQTATTQTNRFAPETPSMFPKPFFTGNKGQLMGPSQLFGQTQPTSGLKKASPTSSRPSPNVYENNMTSPTTTSSPLINRGFATTPLAPFTSPAPIDHSPRPAESRASRCPGPMEVLDEEDHEGEETNEVQLPKLSPRKEKGGLEPIDEYRPYRKRGLNSDKAKHPSQTSLDSDFEQEMAEIRRQRAISNKQRASKSFPEISVPPSSNKSKVEVPSTSRDKQTGVRAHPVSESCIGQSKRSGDNADDGASSQETVADSQDGALQQKSIDDKDSSLYATGNNDNAPEKDVTRPSDTLVEAIKERETIPETSPVGTATELPNLMSDILGEMPNVSSGQPALSISTVPRDSSPGPVGRNLRLSQPRRSARTGHNGNRINEVGVASGVAPSPSVVPESSQRSTKRPSGRFANLTTPQPATELPEARGLSDKVTTSSTYPILSATPPLSSSITPNTETDVVKETSEAEVASSSPTANRTRRPRGRRLPTSSLPESTPSLPRLRTNSRTRQSLRNAVRQSSRHSSLSLDELDRSPSEDVRSDTRKPVRKSTTLREFQSKYGIFEGMVFAISMQEFHQPQRGKCKPVSRSDLEAMIRQEGGSILEDGFSSLFEFGKVPAGANTPTTPTMPSSLRLRDPDIGFTALIADGHSRKVKYMQALALGIPCLAPKWITTCVRKGHIIDWSSYLLCAGSSVLLGDAIRSRSLVPYDAATAKLDQVVSQRPKLLDGSRILLIMKRSKNEEKKLPYVFLARVLGASLIRVYTVEEARVKLREAESSNNNFDWVYVDDHVQDAKALFGSGTGESRSKKRKRPSASSKAVDDRPLKRIRTLNDELVIQSLILGRLVEEEEMEE
ncbi:hypothetical protein GGS20DRAFT_529719 [Poronia punctata]|nr:hypothetical protein GGS20DRAFT_529719 [Poronia punctata]